MSNALNQSLNQNRSLNIVFAGTPEFAARHLAALIDSPHTIVAAYTQPDRPKGRGKKLAASPVKELALEHQIPVYQPASLKGEEAQHILADLNADVMVVVAYGLLLPKAVLEIPRHGCINVHGSILPRWRGAAPIQRAIEAGDKTSGVTIMQMDVGLDTGDMLLKAECPILPTDTTVDLHDRLCEVGPPALLETLNLIAEGKLQPEKQNDSLSNYAKKIEKAEGLINWDEDAETLDRQIRAFNPFPICYTDLHGERLKIHRAELIDTETAEGMPGEILDADKSGIRVQCRQGQLKLLQLQLPGKKAMDSAAFVNGFESLLKDGEGKWIEFPLDWIES